MDERHRVASISSESTHTEAQEHQGELRTLDGVDAFLADLIRRQCQLLDAVAGIVMLRQSKDRPRGASARHLADPQFKLTAKQYQRLAEIGTRAAREDQPIIDSMSASTGLLSTGPDYRVLAAPLRLAGKAQGASVCLLPIGTELDDQEGLTRLDLSGGALEAFIWRQQAYAEAEAKIQLREALDLLDSAHQGHTTQEMASLFAHDLQRRFGCLRVSIGLVQGRAIRVRAISGIEDVDRKSELVEALEAVMEECADQDTEIRFPQPDDADPSDRRVVRAHASMSARYGPAAIASFPLRVDEGLIGVVVMERDPTDPFNDASLRLLRLIAEYIGPTLWTRRMADRGILAVSRDRGIDLAHVLVGPKKTGAKLFALTALVLLLLTVLVPVSDRVVAEGRIIAAIRREISAPFQGRIQSVHVRPGDVVQEGQLLVQLNTDDLDFDLVKFETELRRLRTQADDARAQGNISEASMIDTQIITTQSDIQHTLKLLELASIRAPINGTITQGRLEDMVGEVIKPESPLMEIAQLDTISAIALVTEDGITRVRAGLSGRLAIKARPNEPLDFEVVRVTPVSEVYEQRNVYRVDLKLDNPPDWLRPGMEGRVKIYGNKSNLFTIYARPMVNAFRLRFWWW